MSKQAQWRKPTRLEDRALQIAFSESMPDKKVVVHSLLNRKYFYFLNIEYCDKKTGNNIKFERCII